jgi:hypothetical protein
MEILEQIDGLWDRLHVVLTALVFSALIGALLHSNGFPHRCSVALLFAAGSYLTYYPHGLR